MPAGTGTVAVTGGGTTVTGTGTNFDALGLKAGDTIRIKPASGHPQPYEIASIASDTSLTLATGWGGSTASGLYWEYKRDWYQETAAQAALDMRDIVSQLAGSAAIAQAGVRYAYESSTTMAAPAAGRFRLNNVSLASVTQIAVSHTAGEDGSPNLSAWLASMGLSTNASKGVLYIRQAGARGVYGLFAVTAVAANTGWSQLTVTHIASAGPFAALADHMVEFCRTGDRGIDGDFLRNGSQAMTGNLDLGNNNIVNLGLLNGRAPGPVALNSVNTTSGSSVALTGIASWATNIRVWMDGVSESGTTGISLQLGTSSGLENSGYSGGVTGGITGNATFFGTSTVGAYAGGGIAARTMDGVFDIVKNAGNKWQISGTLWMADTSNYVFTVQSKKTLSGVLDRVGWVCSPSSFDLGSVGGYYW